MKTASFYQLLSLLAFTVLMACHHDQDPTPAPVVSAEQQLAGVDSLITIKLPDVEAIIASSATPASKLRQIRNVSRTNSSDGFTTQLLYDGQQRILGRASAEPLSKAGGHNALIYEYKNDQPYRMYTKVYESDLTRDFIYFVDEFVRDPAGAVIGQARYAIDPKAGQGRLISRSILVYNAAGQLAEVKDFKKFALGQRFTYENNNLKYVEYLYPTGKSIGYKDEYRYDNKPNPLKGLFWDYTADRWNYQSANNLIWSNTIYDDNTYQTKPLEYFTEYDTKNRLTRRASLDQQSSYNELYSYKD